LLERVEKPFPQRDARLSSRRRARAKIYYLFILVIAEPGQCAKRAIATNACDCWIIRLRG